MLWQIHQHKTRQEDKTKYRKLCRKQTGKELAGSLANLGTSMESKPINSALGKKLIGKGIENIPALVKYGTSKINKKMFSEH